jgi:hypothetical protein
MTQFSIMDVSSTGMVSRAWETSSSNSAVAREITVSMLLALLDSSGT